MNTQWMANFIISGLIKPAIILFIISVLWWLLRKRSASLQHFVLSLGVISILLLTLLAIFLATTDIVILPPFAHSLQLPVEWLDGINGWLQQHSSANELLWIAAIYLLPACSMIAYLMLGVVGLWWQTRKAEAVNSPELQIQLVALCELVDIKRPVKLIVMRDLDSPQTWGLLRPVIMLPRAALLWDEDKQLSVLIHELGHIARWDWITQLLVKMVCACFWFLLPIWWIARQIYQQAEMACDDYVFKLRDKHLVYAQNLLAIASDSEPARFSESLHMRGQSPVYSRIMALLDKQRPHQPVAMETAQYWVLCSAVLLVFIANVQLLPWQEQLRARSNFILNIRWSDEPLPKPVSERAAIVEPFSWELLQRIKPSGEQYPAWEDQLEITRVRASKPVKKDLQSKVEIASAPMEIPQIQIQGYLPMDLVTPEYPPIALQKGIEGWVQVEFAIGLQGEILEPRIIAREPSRIFDRTVMNALKKSRYRPQILDGQAVIVQGVSETFHFQLLPPESPRPRR